MQITLLRAQIVEILENPTQKIQTAISNDLFLEKLRELDCGPQVNLFKRKWKRIAIACAVGAVALLVLISKKIFSGKANSVTAFLSISCFASALIGTKLPFSDTRSFFCHDSNIQLISKECLKHLAERSSWQDPN